jgi:cytochrome c oxidase cbb3-type subunit 3
MKTIILLALLAACQGNPRQRDTSGATPGVDTPVGPVPGPGVASHANPNPYSATDPIAVVDGRHWFKHYNCHGCHGDHAGGGMGPSLRDVDWIYGDTDAQIFDSIAEGRAHGMPSWGTKLPEDHIWKMVAYIRSLRTDNEPQAPGMALKAKAPPAAVMPNNGQIVMPGNEHPESHQPHEPDQHPENHP